jgi:alpha-D-ribose 1-methylphosphonate 5-triphosphate synthase subunit PhnH
MTLATVGRAFAQPVHDAQQVFRTALAAMARPGRVLPLAADALAALEPPPGLSPGLAALLLSLLDGETRLWLAPPLASDETLQYLRFHCGVRVAHTPAAAAFVVACAAQAEPGLWSTLNLGTDEAPQAGATLILDVRSLRAAQPDEPGALTLSGPGIQSWHALAVPDLPAPFWHARAALEADYPRGVDLILCSGERIAALPRTTRVALAG